MNIDAIKIKRTVCAEPEIKDKNIMEARLLMPPYAGATSETTAVLQYIYHHYRFDVMKEDVIARIIRDISIVEMQHHELLGTSILKLGGDPVIGANGRFWYGGFVSYGRTPEEMIMFDIKAEEAAIADYTNLIKHLTTPSLIEMIKCIIGEEKEHLEAFKAIYAYLVKTS